MSFFELLLLAVGVSLDAFSVAICKGLAVKELKVRHGFLVAAYFGGFQGLMPLFGFLLGTWIAQSMQAIDHWVILLILGFIGVQMIREALNPESCPTGDFSWRTMLPLAVATSIDAFAVGVTFAMMEVDLWKAIPLITVCTGGIFVCRRLHRSLFRTALSKTGWLYRRSDIVAHWFSRIYHALDSRRLVQTDFTKRHRKE